MIVGFLIQFCISLFDLGVFWHYLLTFRKRKNIPEPVCVGVLILLAVIWALVGIQKNPYINLVVLVLILTLATLFFELKLVMRAASVVLFIGTGIVVEPIGMLLLYAMHYTQGVDSIYLYYLVTAVCAFIRGNAVFLLCKIMSRKELNLLKLPKDIVGVLILVFAFAVVNCCSVTLLSIEMDNIKSKIVCVSVIVSIVLIYYFMLYMIERLNYLAKKQNEDELYREEMHYKEIYYVEAERRNEYVQRLKHDLKNEVFGLLKIAESDREILLEKIRVIYNELELIDADSYSENPSVDSVLRIKLGMAKAEGIKVETVVRIPKQMGLEQGDMGVLYGNLLDNAIEACQKVPEDDRFIRIENKYSAGNLLLVITNSKEKQINEHLETTKKDTYGHGRGISSVRRVVEKYNGTVRFRDKGDVFEASAMLYSIDMEEDDKR